GIAVGQDAGGDLAAAQLLDVLPPGAAGELTVGLPVQPVAEAPAHRGIGVLGPEHGRDVAEPCLRGGPDRDAHQARLRLRGPSPREPRGGGGDMMDRWEYLTTLAPARTRSRTALTHPVRTCGMSSWPTRSDTT